MDDKLKPCPFCGGVAQRVDIPADEHDPNAGGSYIACQFCLASSSIAFGDKSSLVDNWNTRADDARICAEARAEALRDAGNRAIEYVFFEGDNDPVDENGFNAPMISSDGLRAAIANAEKPPCA